jgi:membrane protein YqaA with SNARE-associated domain
MKNNMPARPNALRRLYLWTMNLAGSRYAMAALFAVAFAESSFFPIPPDAVLLPMVLAAPTRWWRIALVCTAGSVIGGMAGYAIGAFLYETVGLWLMHAYNLTDKVEHFRELYAHYGAAIILIKGFTPLPYKLVTIASGLAGYNFFWFVVLSIITRGGKYLLIAWLIQRFGPQVQHHIEKRLELFSILFIVLIILGFIVAGHLV